jgi:hypothetical protein
MTFIERSSPSSKPRFGRLSAEEKDVVLEEVKRLMDIDAEHGKFEPSSTTEGRPDVEPKESSSVGKEAEREMHQRLKWLLELVIKYSRGSDGEIEAGSSIDLVSMESRLNPEELLEGVVFAGMMRSISPASLMSWLDLGVNLNLSPRGIYGRAARRAADLGRTVPEFEDFMSTDPSEPDGDGATVETAFHFPHARGYGEEVDLVKRYMSTTPSLLRVTVSTEPLVSSYDTIERGRIFFRYHDRPTDIAGAQQASTSPAASPPDSDPRRMEAEERRRIEVLIGPEVDSLRAAIGTLTERALQEPERSEVILESVPVLRKTASVLEEIHNVSSAEKARATLEEDLVTLGREWGGHIIQEVLNVLIEEVLEPFVVDLAAGSRTNSVRLIRKRMNLATREKIQADMRDGLDPLENMSLGMSVRNLLRRADFDISQLDIDEVWAELLWEAVVGDEDSTA